MTTTRRLSLAYLALTAGVAVLFALNLFWGSVSLTPGAVAAALLGRGEDALAVGIVLQLRLPRAVMVVLLGAALSAAGYLLQTFFANPIAGPFVMGVSSGAKAGGGPDDGGVFTAGAAHRLGHPHHRRLCRLDGGDGLRAGGGPAGAADEHPRHLRHHDRLYLLGCHRHRGDFRAGLQHRQSPQLVDGQLFRHDLGQCGCSGLRGAARAGGGVSALEAHGGLPRWARATPGASAYRCGPSRRLSCCFPVCFPPA